MNEDEIKIEWDCYVEACIFGTGIYAELVCDCLDYNGINYPITSPCKLWCKQGELYIDEIYSRILRNHRVLILPDF